MSNHSSTRDIQWCSSTLWGQGFHLENTLVLVISKSKAGYNETYDIHSVVSYLRKLNPAV